MKTNIRDIRKKARITQVELSERSGVNYKTISEIESGCRKNIYLTTLQKLAKGLKVPVGSLMPER